MAAYQGFILRCHAWSLASVVERGGAGGGRALEEGCLCCGEGCFEGGRDILDLPIGHKVFEDVVKGCGGSGGF
jgi:hypothetical protein